MIFSVNFMFASRSVLQQLETELSLWLVLEIMEQYAESLYACKSLHLGVNGRPNALGVYALDDGSADV